MTSPWTAADLPDLTGKTVVVTGGSSGLGVVTARELARVGARVVLAVRDVAKGEGVAAAINGSAASAGSTQVRQLDLASLASIHAFAEGWTGDLDVLINNAGIMQVPKGHTVDGFELQIGTNHLGPFALTNLLLPAITGRVVTVSSNLHRQAQLNLADLNWEHRDYRSLRAYHDSKLANLLFSLELQRRLTEAGSPVLAVSAHPGIARTNLVTHVGGLAGWMNRRIEQFITQDVEHGALPTLYAATQDLPPAGYVGPDGLAHLRGYPKIETPSAAAQNPQTARRLWDLSVELTGTGSELRRDGVA